MKQITLISILIFLFGLIFFRENSPNADTQVVLRVNGMVNQKLQINLEKELINLYGVEFCEALLSTKTIILTIDDNLIGQKELLRALDKWDCSIEESQYNKLY